MLQVLAPCEHVRAHHHPKLLRLFDADKRHELTNVDLVGPPRLWVVDVREPLRFGRHLSQPTKLCGSQGAGFAGEGGQLTLALFYWLIAVVPHALILYEGSQVRFKSRCLGFHFRTSQKKKSLTSGAIFENVPLIHMKRSEGSRAAVRLDESQRNVRFQEDKVGQFDG
jgi:hypothetical protein